MPLAIEKLRILTFPQRIDGATLDLRVLVLPTERLLNTLAPFPSQQNPGTTVQLPSFLSAELALEVQAIRGLAGYPFSDPTVLAAHGATLEPFPTDAAFPPGLPALFEGLKSQFTVVPAGQGAPAAAADADGIRKYLPVSYRTAFNFTTPRTPFAKTDDSYHCAIKRSSKPNPAFQQSGNDVTWGRVIAFCLRQPLLAARIGLVHPLRIDLQDADFFRDGGWVWCRLTSALAGFDIVNADTELRLYAARIPAIEQPRPLFGAVLFPVVPGPAQPTGNFDTLKIEAADYDDGFAKVVHATQPVSSNLLSESFDGMHVQKDVGVRLAWDDEQILIWQNRQLLADPATPGKRIEAPLGVFSYRVDVREAGDAAWHSLVRIRSRAALTLGGEQIAQGGTELEPGVQVFPSTVNGDLGATYWLPSYFTQWYGASLSLPDGRAAELDKSGALAAPGTFHSPTIPANPQQVGGLYEAMLPED